MDPQNPNLKSKCNLSFDNGLLELETKFNKCTQLITGSSLPSFFQGGVPEGRGGKKQKKPTLA